MPAITHRYRSPLLAVLCLCMGLISFGSRGFASSHSIQFLASETEALAARLRLVENASTSICIATYQIRDDNSGGQLIAALLDAAGRGVEVRLLIDAHPNSNNLPKPLMRYLVEHGIGLKERPFDVRTKLELGRPRLHDKLFLVDSAALIIGGRNLEQDYFGLGKRRYIDYDVIVRGAVVCEAEAYFEERWNESQSATPRIVGREELKMRKKQIHAYWNDQSYCDVVPKIEAWLAELKASPLQASDLPCRGSIETREYESSCVEFLRDFPNGSKRAPEAISSRILDEIKSAKQSISISTPYFVAPIYLRRALMDASHRGVKVTLLTNSLASTDQVVVHAGYANVRRNLVRHGIQVYEQRGNDPLHVKLIVIDGHKTIIGSHNLDMLSMKRNSEVGLLVHGVEFANEALTMYRSLLVRSTHLNDERLFLYEKRNASGDEDKLKQYQGLRFVAPLIRRYL